MWFMQDHEDTEPFKSIVVRGSMHLLFKVAKAGSRFNIAGCSSQDDAERKKFVADLHKLKTDIFMVRTLAGILM